MSLRIGPRQLIVAAVTVVALVGVAGDGWPHRSGPARPVSVPEVVLADQADVTALAFSPNSRWLAVAGKHGLQLWDAFTGARIRELVGDDTGGITAVAFAPNGGTVAGGDPTGRVRLWNVADGRLVGEMALRGDPQAVTSLAFSPDQLTLAVAGRLGPVLLWNTFWDATGLYAETVTDTEATNPLGALAFSPDGRWLIVVRHSLRATVWDVSPAEPILDATFRADGVDTGGFGVDAMALEPHGLTVALGWWHSLHLVDPATGRTRELVGHRGEVASVAFAPDGRTLVSAGGFYDASVRLWDVRTARQLRLLCDRPACGPFSHVVFSPDGYAVAASEDRWGSVVHVWWI